MRVVGMPLFNKKYIKKQVGEHPAPIPDEHLKTLTDWAGSIQDGSIYLQKETALHGSFKSKIVEGVLGYQDFTTGDQWTVTAEQNIGRGEVDLALGIFSNEGTKILAPFELKGAKTKDLDAMMPGRNKTPVQQAWEYANAVPGCGWVLVCNYVELRLYSYATGSLTYETFYFADLTKPEEYARFMMFLSADALLSGRTQDHLAASQREEKDITNKLYDDYKEIRHVLIDQVAKAAPDLDGETQIAYAQTILDRVLFVAFAEDTSLLPERSLEKAFEHADPYNPKPVWDNFKGLFKAIDKGSKDLNIPRYNGGLFKRHPGIDKLKLDDLVCEGFKRLGEYDFASEVSVTILGHIFEQSITDLERLQAIARGDEVEEEPKKAKGTKGKRKRDGVVYTPDYIARFIVDQTLGGHLEELFDDCLKGNVVKASLGKPYEELQWRGKGSELKAWKEYQKRLGKLRIVDPACGSGVFLVTAFDYLKAEYHRVNAKVADLSGAQPGLFDPDGEILSKNLFGVDVNSESVEITKLSLWLKTARRGKVLDSLDDHLRVGDSIIEDANYAYLEHGFSWREAFPEVYNDGGFDVVLGNPPYVRQELISPMKPYLEKRFSVYHGVADLYCYFFERGLRLLKKGGHLGYISNATFFKTASGKPLREYLSNNASLETVVNFGDTQVFEGVTTYPAILIMKQGEVSKDHQVMFWNVTELPNSNFGKAFDKNKAPYSQINLSSEAWELEDERLWALRKKIKGNRKSLKEVYGAPLYGIKTGRNEAFVIDKKTRDRLISEDPKSAEIIKPFLEGKDLKRWHAESRDLYLIFTRRGIDIENYPAVLKHLEQYREKLEPKPSNWKPKNKDDKWKGRKTGTYQWYEIQDTVDYHDEFQKLKINYPHFCQERLFNFDNSHFYSNDKSYIIPESDYLLLGLLNSSTYWYIITGMSPAVRGGFHELRIQYMQTLPIPSVDEAQKEVLSSLAKACQSAAEKRYKLQRSIVRRIPDLCPPEREAKLSNKLKSWWELEDFKAFQAEIKSKFKADIPLKERNDWEELLSETKQQINALTAEIEANEAKINALVYQLFDLTAEEVKLIEENV
ncbi:hypothetical protein GCM10011332_26270 [Terasakiella brassicae]|uniref:site-specific DNA-methyltransferase (adenine-specific) n=1 Tax=Terasakiella brassicae TaxID=1634917 RepID=A0A917C3T9_9PROT|nr:hypothetical protein GCM10011332_26270 [Terasakiella brassicae]